MPGSNLFILSSPSGGGKTTLADDVVANNIAIYDDLTFNNVTVIAEELMAMYQYIYSSLLKVLE